MKWNPYLGEWVVLPEGATVSDDELRRAALQRIADNAKIVTTQNADGTYTTPLAPPDAKLVVGPPYIDGIGEPWPAERREDIAC